MPLTVKSLLAAKVVHNRGGVLALKRAGMHRNEFFIVFMIFFIINMNTGC